MWIMFSIIAGMFLAPAYVLTKKLSDTYEKGYGRFIMTAGIASAPFALAGLVSVDKPFGWVVVLGGMIYGYSISLFYRSMGMPTVSAFVAATAGQLIPAVIAVMAWQLLDEPMSTPELAAFGVMILGSLITAISKSNIKSSLKGLALLLLAVVITSSYNVMLKYGRNEGALSGWELFTLTRLGMVLTFIAFFATPARMKMMSFFELRNTTKMLFITNESLFIAFNWLFALAIALQVEKNAALASAIYFAVNQLLLFVHSTVTKNDTNTMRKTIGASLALAGLVYIALR